MTSKSAQTFATEVVDSFNTKVAELLKEASANEIVEILKSAQSVVTPLHNNNNQNGGMS
jgi:hypothetical protein